MTTKDQILKALRGRSLKMSELVGKLGISRQAVFRHLQELRREGQVVQKGASKKNTIYSLPDRASFEKSYGCVGLDEDAVYREIDPLFPKGTENVRGIFRYAFTEMLNNAVDHSESAKVDVRVVLNRNDAFFSLTDRGIGVFENIRSKQRLASEMEALQDLLKGKLTTMPERHSGEGIFFTSKVADLFILESHRKKLIVDNRIPDVFVEDVAPLRGTRVSFLIALKSDRKLEDVFGEYTNEDHVFDKSRIVVKLFKDGEDEYISRSQAKRLLHGLEKFKTIVLDFAGVRTAGQGFADEAFRVFPSRHPHVRMQSVNANENVDFMIRRALKSFSNPGV